MLIYSESILGRTVFVTPYKNWIDSSRINQYVNRSILMESHYVTLQNLKAADSFMTIKSRYSSGDVDKSWNRGTMLHKLEDTEFLLATLYCGNELRSPVGRPTDFRYVRVQPKPLHQLEEYLRYMDEIYDYL